MAEQLQPIVPSGTTEKLLQTDRRTPKSTAQGCGLARRVPLCSLSPQLRDPSSTCSSTQQAEAAAASATKAGFRSPLAAARVTVPCMPSPFGSARRVPTTQAELSREQPPSFCTPCALRPPTGAKKTPLAERGSPLPILAKRPLSSPPRGTVEGCGLARRVPLRSRSAQCPWPQGTSPAPSIWKVEGGPASATKTGSRSPLAAARIAIPCLPSPFGSARRVPVTQLSREQPPFSRTPRAQRLPTSACQERDKQGSVPVPPTMVGAQLGCSPRMGPGLGTVLEQPPPSPLELVVSTMELPPSLVEEPHPGALQEPVTSLDTSPPPPAASPQARQAARAAPGHRDGSRRRHTWLLRQPQETLLSHNPPPY